MTLAANHVIVMVSVDLESILFQVLSVVQDCLDTGTIGLVAHVNGESVIVIKFWVLIDEKLSDKLAEFGNVSAEELGDSTGEPVSPEELMDAKKAASIRKLSVEVFCELEYSSLGVGDLGDGAESDE